VDPFDRELREARRIIREHNDNPDDFKFTTTPKSPPGGHIYAVEYTVTVSRGKVPPAAYEGGMWKNWVLPFAHDLGAHRFSEGAGGG